MNPRKNLILALVIAGMAFVSFHSELPIRFDLNLDHVDRKSTEEALSKLQQGMFGDPQLARAIRVQEKNEDRFFGISSVVGTGVGWDESGSPVIKLYTNTVGPIVAAQRSGLLPQSLELDGFPIVLQKAGPFNISPRDELLPNSRFDRPVPMGVSTGHTSSTAGTIGAVVTDGSETYALSNWHVFVPAGKAKVGDELLQPGPIDGGVQPADVIGTLAAFEPVALSMFASNRIDAAIARTDQVMARTPADGYGSPRTVTIAAKPGLGVQKYGRTTGLTRGEVDSINASINVNYGSAGSQVARFTGQVVLCCDMSQGGDSGSLIVAYDVDANGNPGPNDRKPVALLFAGDQRLTIANPIDLVLDRFGVTIVGDDEGR